jgi:hypothetical protein
METHPQCLEQHSFFSFGEQVRFGFRHRFFFPCLALVWSTPATPKSPARMMATSRRGVAPLSTLDSVSNR